MNPLADILARNQGQVLTPELIIGILHGFDRAAPDEIVSVMPGGPAAPPIPTSDPRLVVDDKARVGDWVARRVGLQHGNWGDFGAVGLLDKPGGELVAGTILNGINGTNAFAHVAFSGPWALKRVLIYAFFDYAFRQLDLERLTGTVEADNEAALRFDKHLGFVEEFRIPMGSAPDIIQLVLWRDQCRWLSR